jgi:hypothetical protein
MFRTNPRAVQHGGNSTVIHKRLIGMSHCPAKDTNTIVKCDISHIRLHLMETDMIVGDGVVRGKLDKVMGLNLDDVRE